MTRALLCFLKIFYFHRVWNPSFSQILHLYTVKQASKTLFYSLFSGIFASQNFLNQTRLENTQNTVGNPSSSHLFHKNILFIYCDVGLKSCPSLGAMFLCTLFIERGVYPSNWPIVVFALIGNFTTTLCFAILYMYTGNLYPMLRISYTILLNILKQTVARESRLWGFRLGSILM